jgi:hypothetical protein
MELMHFSGIGLTWLMGMVKSKAQVARVLYPNILKKTLEKRSDINFLT